MLHRAPSVHPGLKPDAAIGQDWSMVNLMVWGGAVLFAIGFVTAPWLMFAGLAMFAAGALALFWQMLAD